MKRRKLNVSITLVSLLMLSLCFTSCNQYFYSANAGNTLDLNEKGDIKIEAATINNFEVAGISGKVGYSPIRHWGIQACYSDVKYSDQEKGYMFNTATGYYHFLEFGKQPDSTKWLTKHGHKTGVLLEGYAGYGFGRSRNQYGFATIHTTMRQYHVQAGITVYFIRVLKFSAFHRLSLLHFKRANVVGAVNEIGLNELQTIRENNPFTLNEISCKLSLGLPYVNAFLLATVGQSNKQFTYENGSVQFGLAFDINDFFKK